MDKFLEFNTPPKAGAPTKPKVAHSRKVAVPPFLNGRKLRDYQEASLDWMVKHCAVSQSCILGDEMGACVGSCSCSSCLSDCQPSDNSAAFWNVVDAGLHQMLGPRCLYNRTCRSV